MVKNLIKENSNSVIVESGNIVNSPDKLDIVTSIFSTIGYDAIGIGQSDLRVGEEYFKKTAEKKLAIVDVHTEKRGSSVPYIIKNVNGVKVGIISFGAMPDESKDVNEFALKKARFVAYKKAREASDILILLDQANVATKEWLESNAQRLGAPDIVIGGMQNMGLLQEEVVGKTRIMPTSLQGKMVGVVDVEVTPGQDLKMVVRKMPLEPSIEEDKETLMLVKKSSVSSEGVHIITQSEADLIKSSPQNKDHTLVPTSAPAPHPTAAAPVATNTDSGALPYYSPHLCKTCHSKEFDDWKMTKHAMAVKTLVTEKKVQGECLLCHSEMFRSNKSVVIPSDGVAGVECATCHASAIPHGMERHGTTNKTKVDPKMCLSCHNKEHSPNYDEKTYFPKVMHAGVVENKPVKD